MILTIIRLSLYPYPFAKGWYFYSRYPSHHLNILAISYAGLLIFEGIVATSAGIRGKPLQGVDPKNGKNIIIL
jgi:hypothetical protein